MKKLLFLSFCFFPLLVNAQKDSSDIFKKIEDTMKEFKIDTSAVPNDQFTSKIKELRSLKAGFNVNEAMEYKIAESKSKNEITEIEYEKVKQYLTNGNGKKWIDNSIIWIYRNHFTLEEVKQIIKFYKTSAGKKMANDFPIIMIQSIKSAEFIMEQFKRQ